MKTTMSLKETNAVSGGIFINPVTVMIAVRLGQLAAPYMVRGVAVVAGAVGTGIGTYLGD